MCAIAGLLNLDAESNVLEKMLDTMRRRGPDGQGIFRDRDCCLLHTRLAVIDPQGGKQPMTLSHNGEEYTLVYNGELYNTQELRSELEAMGHRMNTHCDTEVVLRTYIQFGEECVDHFNGIFAFAVWEKKRKKLFLARDRIGVKPLFYTCCSGGFVFASEIKTLLCYPGVKPRLDASGAAQLIMLGPGRIPGSGVFCGISELEPGYCGVWQNNILKVRRYWYLQDRPHTDTLNQTIEKVRYLVTDSIKRQMVSDVGIGTFLSGGLDSSIISAVCSAQMEHSEEKLRTFSVDYMDNDRFFQANRFQPDMDNEYIRIMAQEIGSQHQWTILSPDTLINELENATVARDLPGMADVDFSLLSFCGEIRKSVKVALSGECADEIFGGYPWYRDPEIRASEGFPWAQNVSQRMELLHPDILSKLNPLELVMDGYRDTCNQSDILPETSSTERRVKEMVNLNFRWFMQTLLDRKDRMSMFHSLEVRVPFCDYRIAEYLYAVPWEMKDLNGREKGLLRAAVKGLLPEKILNRKKSPYPKTFDPAYERAVAARLQRLLEESSSPVFSLIRCERIQSLLSAESSWPWYGQLMRRPQIMAYLLQLDFWMREYCVEAIW